MTDKSKDLLLYWSLPGDGFYLEFLLEFSVYIDPYLEMGFILSFCWNSLFILIPTWKWVSFWVSVGILCLYWSLPGDRFHFEFLLEFSVYIDPYLEMGFILSFCWNSLFILIPTWRWVSFWVSVGILCLYWSLPGDGFHFEFLLEFSVCIDPYLEMGFILSLCWNSLFILIPTWRWVSFWVSVGILCLYWSLPGDGFHFEFLLEFSVYIDPYLEIGFILSFCWNSLFILIPTWRWVSFWVSVGILCLYWSLPGDGFHFEFLLEFSIYIDPYLEMGFILSFCWNSLFVLIPTWRWVSFWVSVGILCLYWSLPGDWFHFEFLLEFSIYIDPYLEMGFILSFCWNSLFILIPTWRWVSFWVSVGILCLYWSLPGDGFHFEFLLEFSVYIDPYLEMGFILSFCWNSLS